LIINEINAKLDVFLFLSVNNDNLVLLIYYRFVLFLSFLRKQESLEQQAIAGQARNDRWI